MTLSVTVQSLELANKNYAERSGNAGRRQGDPVITPFFWAMKYDGFDAVTIQGRCQVLRCCPTCRGNYSGKHTRDRKVYWGCPDCKQITAEE